MSNFKEKLREGFSQEKTNIDSSEIKEIFEAIEACDDDDLAIANIAHLKAEKGVDLDDIIPDESPLYVQGPGFDDCLSPEEEAYIRKKHSNIVLVDNIHRDEDQELIFDSVRNDPELTFQELSFLEKDLDEDEVIKKIIEELEGIF